MRFLTPIILGAIVGTILSIFVVNLFLSRMDNSSEKVECEPIVKEYKISEPTNCTNYKEWICI